MRYQIPQFIEIEDKIFGPFTLKQFLYLGGGASIGFIIWSLLPKFIAVILIVPVAVFTASLAFWTPNSRPFINMVENAFKYTVSNKLYIWKKSEKKPQKSAQINLSETSQMSIPKMSDSRLKELTWSLDVNKNVGAVENNDMNLVI